MLNRRQTALSRELFVLFVQLSEKYFVIRILTELMARFALMLVAIHGIEAFEATAQQHCLSADIDAIYGYKRISFHFFVFLLLFYYFLVLSVITECLQKYASKIKFL